MWGNEEIILLLFVQEIRLSKDPATRSLGKSIIDKVPTTTHFWPADIILNIINFLVDVDFSLTNIGQISIAVIASDSVLYKV